MNDYFKYKIETKLVKKNSFNINDSIGYKYNQNSVNGKEINSKIKMLKLNLLTKTPVKETKKDVNRIMHSPLISDNVKHKLSHIISTVSTNNQSRNKIQYMSSQALNKNERITNSNKDKINQKKREIFRILEFDTKPIRVSNTISIRDTSRYVEEHNKERINRMKNTINHLINEEILIDFEGNINISKIKHEDKKDTSGSEIRRFLESDSDKKNTYGNELEDFYNPNE
jgi:hypothetical protein